jgi:tetratricopeptide (TPR) repeat protein
MVSGRLLVDGAMYNPSPNALLKATARVEGRAPVVVDAHPNRDGTFDIKEDTPSISIYFVDGDRRLWGFARVGQDDESLTMALSSIPDAEAPGLVYCASKAAEEASQKGEPASAVKIYDDLIVLEPDISSTYVRRGRMLARIGKYAEAIADFEEAIYREPREPGPHNDLAWLLATCPVAEHRDGNEAFRHANTACELTEGKNPAFLATLAAALAEQGDFAQAVKGQMKAISLASAAERAAYSMRLDLYKGRSPFRDKPTSVNAPKD